MPQTAVGSEFLALERKIARAVQQQHRVDGRRFATPNLRNSHTCSTATGLLQDDIGEVPIV